MEQKIKEENIENNLVLQSNQYQDLFFPNPSHKNKIRLFSISDKF